MSKRYYFETDGKLFYFLVLFPASFIPFFFFILPEMRKLLLVFPYICIIVPSLFTMILLYGAGAGRLYYPTSTVELRHREISIKKGKNEIVVPENNILSIKCVTAHGCGDRNPRWATIYYRIRLKKPILRKKNIYFTEYNPSPPKIEFPDFMWKKWIEKIDRSEEFMAYINSDKEPNVDSQFFDQFKI